MKKLSSTLPNMVIVLTVIALLSAAALAFTHAQTAPILAEQARARQVAAVAEVVPAFDNNPTEEAITDPDDPAIALYPAREGERRIGTAVRSYSPSGYGGTVEVMVGFDAEGTVTGTTVLSHAETPGLGAKLTEEAFRDQVCRYGSGGRAPFGGKGRWRRRCDHRRDDQLPRLYRRGQPRVGGGRTDGRRGMSSLDMRREFTKGFFRENPVFALLLGMCPTLGVTSSAANGLGMGLATTAVLLGSNIVVAAVKNLIPDKVRIPSYIVIIASFVTVIDLTMAAFLPALHAQLGLFIPLIVVNCIILGRAEAFAGKNGVGASIVDAVSMGLGFTFAVTLLGLVREILGAGAVFGFPLPWLSQHPILIFIMPPGAFIALGFLIATVNTVRERAVATRKGDA